MFLYTGHGVEAVQDNPLTKTGRTPRKSSAKTPVGKGRNGDLKQGDERLLWGRAGGRCQRCNVDLSRDPSGWRAYNLAENAHVIASSTGGVRGDSKQSASLAEKIENHLLLCRDCHKIIDDRQRGDKLFPTDALMKLKHDHEVLVQRLMDLAKKPQSVAVYISAAVGMSRLQPLDINDINMAIVNADMVPALNHPIHIDLLSLLEVDTLDSSPEFWTMARKKVQRELESKVLESTLVRLNQVEHFSLFGLASIPVLALLGNLIPDTRKAMPFEPYMLELNPGRVPLSDEIEAQIRQYDRDAATWSWPKNRRFPAPAFSYQHLSGSYEQRGGDIAVLCELSFPTHEDLVRNSLPAAPLYKFSAAEVNPNLIQAHDDVEDFMRSFRELLSHIERVHGHEAHVHLFGTLPVSCAIALGRVQVKGALSMTLYNRQQNPSRYERGLTLSHEA
ncbi:SAVED domain-containing protein [Pseudomonas rossensis]|uniref:SAVED domain-containing protein n=1 Tax=Pseudomonas rossensis TaxID=2305471 RepID=UPI0032615A6D